ncbi:MAG: hypothetical protein OXG42_03870 [Chloroflexi bacterium]|nr:hypothetical protein [Chloroflexota bacterium]
MPSPTPFKRPRGAHLVGSVPLVNSEAVFREASARLGTRLRRVPDGETGIRTNWIQWQFPLLMKVPEFESADERPGPFGARLQLRADVTAEQITFPELGYRAAAVESYDVFSRLKRAGVIGADVRFQVCLPTPLAVIHIRFIPRDQEVVEQAYEHQLLEELDGILDVIPHDELAIQWDTAVEFAILEGLLPSFLASPEAEIVERLVRLGSRVREGVETGYHLCYGDVEHQHFVEPSDTAKLVVIANGVCAGVERSVDWMHLPVPRGRNDDRYFAPLSGLRLQAETELYLGLVHLTDGVGGTNERIATAQAVVNDFGVATECGFGRRPAETIPALLDVHASVADPS